MDQYAWTYLPRTKTSDNSKVSFNVLTTLKLYCKQNLNIIPSDKNSYIKQQINPTSIYSKSTSTTP